MYAAIRPWEYSVAEQDGLSLESFSVGAEFRDFGVCFPANELLRSAGLFIDECCAIP